MNNIYRFTFLCVLMIGVCEACMNPQAFTTRKNTCETKYITRFESLRLAVQKTPQKCSRALRITEWYERCLKNALKFGKNCDDTTRDEVTAMTHAKWWTYNEFCGDGNACADEDAYYVGLTSCLDDYNATVVSLLNNIELEPNFFSDVCSGMYAATSDLRMCWKDNVRNSNCSHLKYNDINTLIRLTWENYRLVCEDCQDLSAFQAATSVCISTFKTKVDLQRAQISSSPLHQLFYCQDASSAIESFKDCLSLALVDGNCMSGMTVLQEPLAELASDYYSNLCEGYDGCQAELQRTKMEIGDCMSTNSPGLGNFSPESSMSFFPTMVLCVTSAIQDKECILSLPKFISREAHVFQEAIYTFFAPLLPDANCEALPISAETLGHCLLAISGFTENVNLPQTDPTFCSTLKPTLISTEKCILGRVSELNCETSLAGPAQLFLQSKQVIYESLCGGDCENGEMYETMKQSCIASFTEFLEIGPSIFCKIKDQILTIAGHCITQAVLVGGCGNSKEAEVQMLLQTAQSQLDQACVSTGSCTNEEQYELLKHGCVTTYTAFVNLGIDIYCSLGEHVLPIAATCLRHAIYVGGCDATKETEVEMLIQAGQAQFSQTCDNTVLDGCGKEYNIMKTGCIGAYTIFSTMDSGIFCSFGGIATNLFEICLTQALSIGGCDSAEQLQVDVLIQAAGSQYQLRCGAVELPGTCLVDAVQSLNIADCLDNVGADLISLFGGLVFGESTSPICLLGDILLKAGESCIQQALTDGGCGPVDQIAANILIEALWTQFRGQCGVITSTGGCTNLPIFELMKQGCVANLQSFVSMGTDMVCSLGQFILSASETCLSQALSLGGCDATKEMEIELMIQAGQTQFSQLCGDTGSCTNSPLYEVMKQGCVNSYNGFTELDTTIYCSLGEHMLTTSEACLRTALSVGGCDAAEESEVEMYVQAATTEYNQNCSASDECVNVYQYEALKEGCIYAYREFTNLDYEIYCSLGGIALEMLEVCLKKALSIGVCNAAKQTEVQALIESATSHYTQLCSNFSGPDSCIFKAVQKSEDIIACYNILTTGIQTLLGGDTGDVSAMCSQISTTIESTETCVMDIMNDIGCVDDIPGIVSIFVDNWQTALTAICLYLETTIAGSPLDIDPGIDLGIDLEGDDPIIPGIPGLPGALVKEKDSTSNSVAGMLPSAVHVILSLGVAGLVHSIYY